MQYERCPARVQLAFAQHLPYSDFLLPGVQQWLARGSLFEAAVVAAEQPTVVPGPGLPDLAAARECHDRVRNTELLRNHDLGLQGIVDLIAVEDGIYAPVEIKQHRLPGRTDALELAFLLATARAAEDAPQSPTARLPRLERR